MFPPNVPHVGLPFELGVGYAMAVIRCRCNPANKAELIRGTDTPYVCPCCRSIYGITEVYFNIADGKPYPRIGVNMLGKMPDAAQG